MTIQRSMGVKQQPYIDDDGRRQIYYFKRQFPHSPEPVWKRQVANHWSSGDCAPVSVFLLEEVQYSWENLNIARETEKFHQLRKVTLSCYGNQVNCTLRWRTPLNNKANRPKQSKWMKVKKVIFTVSNILVKYCPGVEQSEIPVTRPLLRRVKIIHIQPEEERWQQKFVFLRITAKSRIILKSIKTI